MVSSHVHEVELIVLASITGADLQSRTSRRRTIGNSGTKGGTILEIQAVDC